MKKYWYLAKLWAKMGVINIQGSGPHGSGASKPNQKSCLDGGTFGAGRYLKMMFSKFSGVNPP